MSTFGLRLKALFKALLVVWLVAGVIYCTVVQKPGINSIALWIGWFTVPLFVGLLLVGVPVVALGDRLRLIPIWLFACIGGLEGALSIFALILLLQLLNPRGVSMRLL